MTSSSSAAQVLRGDASTDATGLLMPELRGGGWTRWGNGAVRGDDVTEQLLSTLAESTRQAARAQGYSVGWAEGRRDAEAAVAEAAAETARRTAAEETRRETEHAAALTALRAAAEQLVTRVDDVCRAVDGQAAELALELTRELVGRAVPEAASHAVERVLGLLPDHPVVRVRFHPAVAASAGVLRDRGVVVLADPDLGPADAVVEADDHVVDLRVDTALERLREVLS
jgi:flagellar assembly protein FliH